MDASGCARQRRAGSKNGIGINFGLPMPKRLNFQRFAQVLLRGLGMRSMPKVLDFAGQYSARREGERGKNDAGVGA